MSGFKEGELIFSSKPYAYVLNDRYRGQFCDYCFKKNDELKRCGQCHHLYYCDKNCQKQAWEMHKTECKFLKGSVVISSNIRLTILVLMKVRKYGYEVPFEEVGNRRATMASLMSHAENFKKEHFKQMMTTRKIIEMYIGSDNVPPFNEFVEIIGKLNTNMFSIDNGGPLDMFGPYGGGLYLGPSFFDHSCDADAAYTFDGTTLNVRMMRSVPHRDISRVRISYFNEISLKKERMEHLLESKFFACSCSICTSPKYDELLTKLVSDAPEIKEKAMKCKKELEDLLSKGPGMDEPHLRYAECKRLLESQCGVFADTNVYRIRTLEKAFDVCLTLQKTDEAVKLASLLEKPYRMYYNTNHPKLGTFLFEYGLHLFSLGCHPEALSKLFEAETKLKVTYGEDHPVVLCNKDLNAKIIDIIILSNQQ